jgi:hypothetical protein
MIVCIYPPDNAPENGGKYTRCRDNGARSWRGVPVIAKASHRSGCDPAIPRIPLSRFRKALAAPLGGSLD